MWGRHAGGAGGRLRDCLHLLGHTTTRLCLLGANQEARCDLLADVRCGSVQMAGAMKHSAARAFGLLLAVIGCSTSKNAAGDEFGGALPMGNPMSDSGNSSANSATPSTPIATVPASATDVDVRYRAIEGTDATAFGLTADEILERIAGVYEGRWDGPLHQFSLRLAPAAVPRVLIRERGPALPAGPDKDSDGVVDGSMELLIDVDVALTTGNGALHVQWPESQFLVGSARGGSLGRSATLAELGEMTEALFDGLPDSCDRAGAGFVWLAPDAYVLSFAIYDATTKVCATFITDDVTRELLPR